MANHFSRREFESARRMEKGDGEGGRHLNCTCARRSSLLTVRLNEIRLIAVLAVFL